VRIIAGEWRRRLLQAPPGEVTRPTADRTRETLFAMLTSRLGSFDELAIADLFAGSGALGLEALSRGAATATFVDSAPSALRVLRANLEALGAEAEVVRADALRWLAAPRAAQRHYSLVFLDPPYRRAGELGAVLSAALPGVLASEALVVAESDRRAPLELTMPTIDERRYGDTLIRLHAA